MDDNIEKVIDVQDVLCLVVPERISDTWPNGVGPGELTALAPAMNQQAFNSVWEQWPPERAPDHIEFEVIEWLVTNRREMVEQFQPAHSCEQCRAGNDQAEAFLRDNPGRYVAMANITYTETWLPTH